MTEKEKIYVSFGKNNEDIKNIEVRNKLYVNIDYIEAKNTKEKE